MSAELTADEFWYAFFGLCFIVMIVVIIRGYMD